MHSDGLGRLATASERIRLVCKTAILVAGLGVSYPIQQQYTIKNEWKRNSYILPNLNDISDLHAETTHIKV